MQEIPYEKGRTMTMTNEHKELVLAHLLEMKRLLEAQSEMLLKQSELIEKQDEALKAVSKALVYATETTGLMSHKIAELQADHQLVSLIKPVNSWMN